MTHLRGFDARATVFYKEGVGYTLYVLRGESENQQSIAALEYSSAAELLEDLEILIRRDDWGLIASNGKLNHAAVAHYNAAQGVYEIPGIEVVIIAEQIIIYPPRLPIHERLIWSEVLMANSRVDIPRIGFTV